jgi:hypothetical protein
MANHLIDATDQRGVESLGRFARMALAGGGRLYADFCVLGPDEDRYVPSGRSDRLRPKDADGVALTLEQAGAVIVHRSQVEVTSGPREFTKTDRPVVRMVAEWQT